MHLSRLFFPLTLYCFAEKAYAAFILGYLQAENCLDMAHDFPAKPDDAASILKMALFAPSWLLRYQLVEPITALLACLWLLDELDRGLICYLADGYNETLQLPGIISAVMTLTTVWRRKG